MATSIHELTAADSEAVRAFNARLKEAGVPFVFPAVTKELMQREQGLDSPYQTAYVVGDGDGVHGGYILKQERLFAARDSFAAGNYQLPLSEGIINRKYAVVGLQLIKDALARQSRLYCLGMGSTARPLPQLLRRLGWRVSKVPFLFRIERAGTFSSQIRWLRERAAFRHALDLARATGLLAAYVGAARIRRRIFGVRIPADVSSSEVDVLPAEIDELFLRVRGDYGLLCDRRAAAMNKKLPSDPKLSRLVLHRSGKLAGWVVISASHLSDHKQFGNMTVGCIVDGLAAPRDVAVLSAVACKRLEAAACDLLVSNQSHPAWIAALRQHGFLRGPSNFVLALSPELTACVPGTLAHFTRADGDGPINL